MKRSRKEIEDDDKGVDILNNIKIHPLLQMNVDGSKHEEEKNVVGSDNKRKKINPILSDWKQREGFLINPYIDQSDLSIVPERRKRIIRINEPGKYIERANHFRDKIKAERIENEQEEQLKKLNLIPDSRIGEELYEEEFKEPPPYVEWWDEPFLKNRGRRSDIKYDGVGEDVVSYKGKDVEEDEDNPITSYIQHPVPIEAPWVRLIPQPKPLFLTKREQKRLRKNRRMIEMKEKQDRIKLGLDPTPGPKIKLKNLMNVLTNETIKNPTEVEMRVRMEIQEREDEHKRMNEERKLSKEERREKIERKIEEDKKRGIFRCIFVVDRLVNPKHVYKVDMNAKQLMLTGVCIRLESKDGKSMIIVEGGYKNVEKYKRLMTKRIDSMKLLKQMELEKLENWKI